jgi:hypothetical protein
MDDHDVYITNDFLTVQEAQWLVDAGIFNKNMGLQTESRSKWIDEILNK